MVVADIAFIAVVSIRGLRLEVVGETGKIRSRQTGEDFARKSGDRGCGMTPSE